ncbi:hypothetical protein ZHAS_00013362 [Anopheles sinensis]|uniref:ANK_REP_REGION domain-containing protein n=1 Tax=Anopheles sinensis TaxID=74873 RepID=A0A084W5D6_ANOSI|nr:hypothetical protein ZHAS_00013362 [Anopheles sinensis]
MSLDKDNLTALLEDCPNVSSVVEQLYKGRTALFLLFEELNPSNATKAANCIKVLLNHGADVNTSYQSKKQPSVSAIEVLLRGKGRKRQMILQLCLQTGKVALNEKLRKRIQLTFPDILLPEADEERLQKMIFLLEAKNDGKFITSYEEEESEKSFKVEEIQTLLEAAISYGREQVVQNLLDKEMTGEDRAKLLEHSLVSCCKYGIDWILEWLLEEIENEDEVEVINDHPLLALATKKIDRDSDSEQCGFFKCMELLLEDGRIDVNKTDGQGFTALHYAVKLQLDHVQRLLLTNGAYVGGEDLFGRALICKLDPYLLNQHLNECLTENEHSSNDPEYMIKLDFRNFQSPTRSDEMLPIVRLAQSSAGRELLGHPVITSIMLVKWLRISSFFYLNLIIYSMFFFSFTALIMLHYDIDNPNQTMDYFFLAPTFVGLGHS